MALEIKQQMRLSQQLVITPQLQQAIKLLQLSRLELQNLIQKELVENPLLEDLEAQSEDAESADATPDGQSAASEDAPASPESSKVEEVGTKEGELKEPKDFDWDSYLGLYNAPHAAAAPAGRSNEDGPTYENTLGSSESLQDHLYWQLHLWNLTEEQCRMGEEIIGNINDDGYLVSTTEEIATKSGVSVDAIEACLRTIQQFDPPGVAARNLQECLLIQSRQVGGLDVPLLSQIITNHMKELEKHHYTPIAKKLKVPYEKARELVHLIHAMEPKPGRPYSQENAQYITPDVYVVKMADDYEVILNEDGLPKLQVSQFYRRALDKESAVTGETREYLQNKMKSALWLIKSIHQRQRTLYKVTMSIAKFQREFLDKGIEHLRPMILRDVAEDIQMHESTVSRVTTSKYVHTPRGIFELKFFFNSGVQRAEGTDVAAESVRQRIHDLIRAEDAQHPLSDEAITQLLRKDNIVLARRTVAKYRETMTIPPSSQRRRIED